MPNVNNPNGFRPYCAPYSGGGQAQVTYHPLLATNAAIGVGTPVAVVAGGVDRATAAGANALLGIAAEPKAASAGGTIAVWSNPQQEFVAQTDDGTGTATALGAIGLNADFIGTGTTNGQSTAEIDEDSATTTATLAFKLLRLATTYERNALNAFGEFNKLVVKINNHQLQGGTGTAGI